MEARGNQRSQMQCEDRIWARILTQRYGCAPKSVGAVFEILEQEQLLEETVNGLRNDKAVGWFQGRMEFGPRALETVQYSQTQHHQKPKNPQSENQIQKVLDRLRRQYCGSI